MADKDDRAVIGGDRLDQRGARLDVEMVGRLVQHHDVRRVEGGEGQQQPRLLAARELGDLGHHLVGAEAEEAAAGADLGFHLVRHLLLHVAEGRAVHVEFVDLVLGEIADAQLGRAHDAAAHGFEALRDQLGEGRLAVAVLAEQGNAVVGVDAQRQLREHDMVAVAGRDVLEHQHRRRHLLGLRKDDGRDALRFRNDDGLHLLQRLDAALRLAGLGGLGLEAVDEGLEVLGLRVLLGLGGLEQVELHRPLLLEAVEAAGVERQFAVFEMEDRIDGAVEEVAVVADQQHGVRIAGEIVLKPQRAFEVEIVGRLVEQQQVGFGEEDGRERDAHPPAAREIRAGAHDVVRPEAEAGEDGGGPGRGRLGLDVEEPRFDLGDPVRVVRRVALGEKGGAFGVGGEHHVEQRGRAGRRFLRDPADPEAPGQRDAAAFGIELALDRLEQRRLARAVAADQPDLVPGRDEGRSMVNDEAPGDPARKVVDGQHGRGDSRSGGGAQTAWLAGRWGPPL